MKIQNKIEIDLSEEDVKNILYEHLRKGYGDGEYSFKFKAINRPIRNNQYWTNSPGSISIDRYEFDGVKIVVS
jgi:hypothetical protein